MPKCLWQVIKIRPFIDPDTKDGKSNVIGVAERLKASIFTFQHRLAQVQILAEQKKPPIPSKINLLNPKLGQKLGVTCPAHIKMTDVGVCIAETHE